jgi:hypothetical protein
MAWDYVPVIQMRKKMDGMELELERTLITPLLGKILYMPQTSEQLQL